MYQVSRNVKMKSLKHDPRRRRTGTKWMDTAALPMTCVAMLFIASVLAQFPQLRCSINFDKDFYMPGETVTMYGAVGLVVFSRIQTEEPSAK
ncbi:hypothetical protein DRO58_01840 [Candidatus Bathyarchaeota archaeon]|nr:MAG: hypothetical protein DRO58_01840 [Candidatus Bathyarchaeota archaeon]